MDSYSEIFICLRSFGGFLPESRRPLDGLSSHHRRMPPTRAPVVSPRILQTLLIQYEDRPVYGWELFREFIHAEGLVILHEQDKRRVVPPNQQ